MRRRLRQLGREEGVRVLAAAAGRVPFFVLVRKLEEATAALRLERDTALEEVGRNKVDLRNLEEQLSTARAQLQGKTATIDKLVREHTALEEELAKAKEAPSEAKYEALQHEATMMTRDFLTRTLELEQELEQMRARVRAAEAQADAGREALEVLGTSTNEVLDKPPPQRNSLTWRPSATKHRS